MTRFTRDPWDPRSLQGPAVAVVLLALLASATSLANGFAYDDRWIVVDNPNVHDLAHWWNVFGETYWPTTRNAALYRPLTILAYQVQWAVGGEDLAFRRCGRCEAKGWASAEAPVELERVLDLGRTNTESEARKRAMRAGMRVTADHRHARQRRALLGSDHMDDALTAIVNVEVDEFVLARVAIQRFDLDASDLVIDRLFDDGRPAAAQQVQHQ